MNIIDRIRITVNRSCVADEIVRAGCTLRLSGTPEPRLLVDLDLPGSPLDENAVRCDYLAFVSLGDEMLCVVPVEFKRSWRGKMVEQLQAGASEAEKYLPAACECRFRAVGVFERFSPKIARRALRLRVGFRGRWEPVRVATCGEKLIGILLS